MFKNATVFRLEHWNQPPLCELEERLKSGCFVPCGPTQPESAGWIEPRGEAHGAMVESLGGQYILRLATETKAVPSQVIKAAVESRLDAIERETGRRPRGKLVKELKEELTLALLPRAFPKRHETTVWIDPKMRLVAVGQASAKKADAVATRLVEALGNGCKLATLQTTLAPATAMSTWLASKEAPEQFTIDRECELRQPDTEKASVRYARHTLDVDEVGEHIRQGKLPTQLAMTFAGRVSLVLTEALNLKKITFLEVALQSKKADEKGGCDFDADVALFTGEMRPLIQALLDALGGLQETVTGPSGDEVRPGGAEPAGRAMKAKSRTEAVPG